MRGVNVNTITFGRKILSRYSIPYARYYKPRLVYFFTPKTIYVLWPLALCMACIQERLLIKSGLWWRAYGIWTPLSMKDSTHFELIHISWTGKNCLQGGKNLSAIAVTKYASDHNVNNNPFGRYVLCTAYEKRRPNLWIFQNEKNMLCNC